MGPIEKKCFTRKIYDLGKTRVLTKNKTKWVQSGSKMDPKLVKN